MDVGDILPDILLKSSSEKIIDDFDLHQNLKNKDVLMICVPGAYTSTCHNRHLPSFIKNYDFLKKEKDIDEIYCISVNDPYVMQQWSISLESNNIIFLSDGNGELGKKTKLLKNFNYNLMGLRFKRCVIRVNNLIIRNIIIDETGLSETSYEEILKTI